MSDSTIQISFGDGYLYIRQGQNEIKLKAPQIVALFKEIKKRMAHV